MDQVSRRRFLVGAGAAGVAAWLAPARWSRARLHALEEQVRIEGPVEIIRRAALTDPVQVRSLRGGLYLLSGSGGNVTVLPGRDGTLLIDSGIVGVKIAAAVATVTDAPIRHLVNTHWHFDHTDANAWLCARGAVIVAQENTRRHLAVDTRVEDWHFTFPRSPAVALPSVSFRDNHTLHLNGTRIELSHFPPAHTDSDIAVHFTDSDVLHVADTWWNGIYPFIDYSTGGSIDGSIAATEQILARVTTSTVLVPGHGPVGDRVALAQWRDMLIAVRGRVANLKHQGRSLAETIKARPTAPFDDEFGGSVIGPDFFTQLVYRGV